MRKSVKIGLLIAASGMALYGSYKAYKAYKKIKQDLEIQKLNEALEEAREVSESIQTKEVVELNGEEKELSEFEAEQEFNKVNGLPYFEMQPDGLFHEFQVVDGMVQETPDSIAAFYDDSADKAFEKDEETEEPFFVDKQGSVYLDREELGQMRYPANSPEAVEQYKNFILADVANGTFEHDFMDAMFNHIYVPTREFDENAVNEMVARRIDFFGDDQDDVPTSPSNVTIAEVLVYYAEKLNWDYDWDIDYIVQVFAMGPRQYMPNWEDAAKAINSNSLIWDRNGEKRFGIFMLEEEYSNRYFEDESFGLWSQMQNLDEDTWEDGWKMWSKL